jgi:hypothetical protein
MKTINLQISTCLLMFLISGAVSAQGSDNSGVHPLMSSKFNLGIGVYSPRKQFDLQVDGNTPGDKVDFDEVLDLDDSESTLSVDFRWRYTKNWSLWAQYWAIDSQGSSTLTEDFTFEDTTFLAGSFVGAGIKTSITRIFFGRSFLNSKPRHELGFGAGLHWMELDAFVEGRIDVAPPPPPPAPSTEFRREEVDTAFPLPNFGVWYMYSWSPKWLFAARVDWLSVTFGDYSGGLSDTQIGINYQMSKIFGVAFSYDRFNLNVDAKSSDLSGQIETGQSGPRLTLTATF